VPSTGAAGRTGGPAGGGAGATAGSGEGGARDCRGARCRGGGSAPGEPAAGAHTPPGTRAFTYILHFSRYNVCRLQSCATSMQVKFCGEGSSAGLISDMLLYCRLQVVDLIRVLVKAQHGGSAPAVAPPRPPQASALSPAQQRGQPRLQAGYGDSAAGRPAAAAAAPAAGEQPAASQPGAAAEQEGVPTQRTQDVDSIKTNEMRRLAGERAALIATGIYCADDPLIQQLDVRMGRPCAAQLQQ
jgi:hypothetical protein